MRTFFARDVVRERKMVFFYKRNYVFQIFGYEYYSVTKVDIIFEEKCMYMYSVMVTYL